MPVALRAYRLRQPSPDMCKGILPTEATKDRLLQATGRINKIAGTYQ